jgi:hypothetical protein
MDGFLGLLTVSLIVFLTIRSRRSAKKKGFNTQDGQSALIPPKNNNSLNELSAPKSWSQNIERSNKSKFKRSSLAPIAPEGLAIEETKGWTAIEGFSRYVHVERGSEIQRNVQKLFNSVAGNDIPVRLKFDPFSKDSVSVFSQIGNVCELRNDYAKPWIKRISKAAEDKKFYVGLMRLQKAQNSERVYVSSLYLDRPYEIAIEVESITSKSLSAEQIEKLMSTLSDLIELYPETNAQVRSQAKKAVKAVAVLYGHALGLDESTNKYKEALKDLCSEFIYECEDCADSEDDIGSEIEYFIESWNECVAQTGAYAPIVPSAFAVADIELLANKPELSNLLEGKSIVFTGDFDEFSRDEGQVAIESRGGKSPGSVSGKTFALVVGTNPGDSKLAKAHALNTPVINVEQFKLILLTGNLNN